MYTSDVPGLTHGRMSWEVNSEKGTSIRFRFVAMLLHQDDIHSTSLPSCPCVKSQDFQPNTHATPAISILLLSSTQRRTLVDLRFDAYRASQVSLRLLRFDRIELTRAVAAAVAVGSARTYDGRVGWCAA